MGRTARVAFTGIRIYARYRRTERRTRGRESDMAQAEWLATHERSAEELYRLATRLRGLYVKVGQFAGTRSDIVPAPYVASLSRLQDRMPPRPVSQVRKTIQQEFRRPSDELFARFDETPIATASLAQVHRAALRSGEEVVVKVQHPEVASLVPLDIRNLQMMLGFVARRQPGFDYRAIAAEVSRQVPLELDFVRESEMTARVAANLSACPGVVVPRVIAGFVTRRVLVLEYLEGQRLLAPEHLEAQRAQGAALSELITSAYAQQILVDGVFQADPHPGNILVLPGGRVALLDFGLTKELPAATRLGFARLVAGAATRDMALIQSAWAELGVRSRDESPAARLELLHLLFGARDDAAPVRATLSRNPVEAVPPDLMLLGRVIGLLRGVCASLGSPLTPMEMLRPVAERVISEQPGARGGAAIDAHPRSITARGDLHEDPAHA
jgi:predicted unusual protein kinase regulating ubiquinone biosynthesis (AarF/ABC1/UbiB family)